MRKRRIRKTRRFGRVIDAPELVDFREKLGCGGAQQWLFASHYPQTKPPETPLVRQKKFYQGVVVCGGVAIAFSTSLK